jgi:hypothetical protein
MANIYVLKLHADGYPSELDPTTVGSDILQLPSTTFEGDINLGGNEIKNISYPTEGDSAVNKSYVDAIASGLVPHEAVIVKTPAILTSYVSGGGTGVGHTLTAPDFTVAHNTIDGFLLTTIGQRVLVSMQGGDDATAHKDNGVYRVSALANGIDVAFELTRTTDADQAAAGEMETGLYVFVTDGSTLKNTGWTLVTTGTIVMETTALKFAQFSGAPGLTYDQGLKRDVNSVYVHLDDVANAQGAGAPTAARKSGLEFDADSAAGKLRVAVAAAGGLERYQTSTYGLAILVDNTDSDATLGLTADGVKVLGLPASFTIDGDAVNVLVTADNLTELVDGSSTTLHSHPGAGESERIEYDFVADGAISLGDPVYLTSAGKVSKARADTDAKAFACGLAHLGGIDGFTCPVVFDGVAKAVFSSDQTIGDRWYVGATGGLTKAVPGAHNHVMQMGFTCAVRDFAIQKQYIGKKI